jgi:Holliday junction resolvase RusA-like endonuclease
VTTSLLIGNGYTITIPGELRGKGRPRFSTQRGRPRAYTDAKTASAETWIKVCAIEQVGQPMLMGALNVTFMVGVAVPASWSKKKRAAALIGEIRPTGKPDFDNLAKLVSDALNRIVWVDDAQITDVSFIKRYLDTPSTTIIVRMACPP